MKSEDYIKVALANGEIFGLFSQGLYNYRMNFMAPIFKLLSKFTEADNASVAADPSAENISRSLQQRTSIFSYMDEKLSEIGGDVLKLVPEFYKGELGRAFQACLEPQKGETIEQYQEGLLKALKRILYEYPQAIANAAKHYSFQFDNGKYEMILDTPSFIMYKVLPTKEGVEVNENYQPMLFVHPYVLGPNVMAFFPDLDRSFIHAFANMGVPCYLRYRKKPHQSSTVLATDLEDDILVTQLFCQELKKRYKKPVVINAYCHGGWLSLVAMLSGKLDNLVDTLIMSVAPIDAAMAEIYHPTVNMVKTLGTDTKKIADVQGDNYYIDGDIISLFVKLPTAGKENGIYSFFDTLLQFRRLGDKPISIEMAGMQHWLIHERVPMSVNMLRRVYEAYINPIAEDGTFPATAFGKKLNLKRLDEKGIKVYVCYAEKDYIVPPATCQTLKKWVNIEEVAFPKGHAAIATSWSKPGSECFIGSEFGGKRGPLKYYLDLQAERGYDKVPTKPKAKVKAKAVSKTKPKAKAKTKAQ
jgi:poly(3-hydroxyalkanoate) synthetase